MLARKLENWEPWCIVSGKINGCSTMKNSIVALLFCFNICFLLFTVLQMYLLLSYPTPPSPNPTSGLHYTIVCVHMLCIYKFFVNLFLPRPFPLKYISLLDASMFLDLVDQFIIFIKFFIKVRSYDICLSLTVLFHLA